MTIESLKQEYREKLEKSLALSKEQEEVATVIKQQAKEWGNKQLNKRFATVLESKLPEYFISWGKKYGFSEHPSLTVRSKISRDREVELYEVKDISDLLHKNSIYIEAENDVMHKIYEQQRHELAVLPQTCGKLEYTISELKATMDAVILRQSENTYNDNISYSLKDFIKKLLDQECDI